MFWYGQYLLLLLLGQLVVPTSKFCGPKLIRT